MNETDKKLRLHFTHVPKTGGVSIVRTLKKVSNIEFINNGHKFSPNNSVFREEDTKSTRNIYFACWRDPIDRLYSAYEYVKQDVSMFHDNLNPTKRKPQHPDWERIRDKSFKQFVQDLYHNRSLYTSVHFRPQVEFTSYRGIDICVDYLLDSTLDLTDPWIRFQMKIGYRLPDIPRYNKHTYHEQEHFGYPTIGKIVELYQFDYDMKQKAKEMGKFLA